MKVITYNIKCITEKKHIRKNKRNKQTDIKVLQCT